MHDTTQQRRFISPVLLLAVILCFFLPFFSVSCSSGLGQMEATVTGMDQVFGGEPQYSGFRPPPTAEGAPAQDQKSQISPTALTGFAAIIVGIGLGLGLPGPRARWISGAVASVIALSAVAVNQILMHRRAQDALDQAMSSLRDQLASNPIFGRSVPVPALAFSDEPGFWVVTVLLGLAVAYNVFEVVLPHRPNSLPRLAAGGSGGPVPPPLPPMNGGAPGRLPGPQSTRPPSQWPGPAYPPALRRPPQQSPHQMPGHPPRYWPNNP